MKAWYPVLVAATILCLLWCVSLWAIFPIGPVDGLYVTIGKELAEVAGDQEARRLMPVLTRAMVDAVRAVVISTAIPLLATNVGWGYLAYRLLRKTGDLT